MPDWLHRTDLRLLHSVSEAELPEPAANYIREPDLSAVRGQLTRYWEISGDTVSLMDRAARDTADLTDLNSDRDSASGELDDVENLQRATILAQLEPLNALETAVGIRLTTFADIQAVARSKLGS